MWKHFALVGLLLWSGAAVALPPPLVPVILSSCSAIAAQPSGGTYDAPPFTGWSDNATTHVLNGAVSPDCSKRSAVITEDGTTAGHYLSESLVASITAASHTFTSYAKRGYTGQRNYIENAFSSTFASEASVGVSLSTCAITLTAVATGSWSGVSATSTALPGGWCKVTLTWTAVVDTQIFLLTQIMSGAATSSYAGDSSSSIWVWGADFR